MSLDTKYRPRTFDDVLGQEATVKILRQFIATGTGYRQSYLFAGPYGSGKTTLGRLLARGLLCEKPTERGDPCDTCDSCRSILEGGTHTDFTEVDAATNSGKGDIKKLLEEIEFSTFGGGRRIYLLDESHQLSASALDALLKPLEENLRGTEDKKLVCIFCTTEPEKMRGTILSRCAPAFLVRPLPPETIAGRLAFVCDQEGIEYDADMLPVIAEITECHIRDALKAVEGVSMLGALDKANITTYLHLDLNDVYLNVLLGLGQDLSLSMKAAAEIMLRASPLICYRRLASLAMLAYRVSLGVEKPAAYWDAEKMGSLSSRGGDLLRYASTFSSRLGRPSPSMLYCDIAQIHHGGGVTPLAVQQVVAVPAPTALSSVSPSPQAKAPVASAPQTPPPGGTLSTTPPPPVEDTDGIVVDQRAVRKGPLKSKPSGIRVLELTVDEFCWLVGLRVAEMDEVTSGGHKGRSYMDRR